MRLLCPHRTGWVHRSIWLLVILNALFYTATTILSIWSWMPWKDIKLVYGPSRQGINVAAIMISGAAVNFVSDVSILVLPIYQIWQLQLSTARKIGVSSVFSAGLL